MSKSEVEPKKWWIDPKEWDEGCGVYDAFKKHPRQGHLQWQESLIQVIEYLAYQTLQKENEELKTALSEIKEYRWCPRCHNEVSRLIANEALKKD